MDHEGTILDAIVTKKRGKAAAYKFMKKLLKRYGCPKKIVTGKLRSYRAAMKGLGLSHVQECGRWMNNQAENAHLVFRRREAAMSKFRSMKSIQKFTAIQVKSTTASMVIDSSPIEKPTASFVQKPFLNGGLWPPEI